MFALAIHGGAGTLARDQMTAAQEREYLDGLGAALDAGHALLARGEASLERGIELGHAVPVQDSATSATRSNSRAW